MPSHISAAQCRAFFFECIAEVRNASSDMKRRARFQDMAAAYRRKYGNAKVYEAQVAV